MPETSEMTMGAVAPSDVGTHLTASSVGALRPRIKAMIAEGVRDMVLDFGACTVVDSSGVGLLVATHNSLSKLGGKLSLIRVSAELHELFQTMRLHQHFSISQSA